jgi:capsule polysaccharide export protein KpsE/RkpR
MLQTAAKETAEQALAEKEAELATVKETLTAKEAEVAELTTTKEGLEASLEEEKQARIQTVEENAKLATDIHKMVAEHVVDLRLSLGKESDREEAITRFVERSTDSLNDTLADLLVEAAQAPAQPATRQVEKIERPAGTVDNTIEVKESETKLTTQDVLMNLFGGPGLKK